MPGTASVLLPDPFTWDGEHLAVELPGGGVRFTTRRGGTSAAPYDTLNVGDHVGDDPEAVAANREIAARLAGRPSWVAVHHALQVHGTTVATDGDRPAEADAQATADPEAAVAVFTADCVPIALVADGAVAAVHAGWKGLACGIVGNGVDALRALGAEGPVHAAIGPCARGCCYEVGEEVHAHFAAYDARRGERNLALESIAAQQLAEAGAAAVHDTGLCTLCAPEGLLFSHRRDGGTTGRQALIAWRA